MNVKDRIAMWNSMATNTNNPPPSNPPKVATSSQSNKPAPQQQTHMHTSENLGQKHQVEVPSIVKPSDAKKKAQMEQSQPVYPVYKAQEPPKKPNQTSYKQS